jgi:hypothetical protein
MAASSIKMKICLAWWLKPYLYGLIIVSKITGRVIDQDKLLKVIDKAVKIKLQLNNDNR